MESWLGFSNPVNSEGDISASRESHLPIFFLNTILMINDIISIINFWLFRIKCGYIRVGREDQCTKGSDIGSLLPVATS